MTPAEKAEVRQDYDRIPVGCTAARTRAPGEDLDRDRMTWFIGTAHRARQFPLAEDAPPDALLEHLNLLNRGRLTNAAVLLFGRTPQRFLFASDPRHDLTLSRRWLAGTGVRGRRDVRDPDTACGAGRTAGGVHRPGRRPEQNKGEGRVAARTARVAAAARGRLGAAGGRRVADVRIRRMKTRWGTCNPDARRLWLNLELAKEARALPRVHRGARDGPPDRTPPQRPVPRTDGRDHAALARPPGRPESRPSRARGVDVLMTPKRLWGNQRRVQVWGSSHVRGGTASPSKASMTSTSTHAGRRDDRGADWCSSVTQPGSRHWGTRQ